MEPLSDKFDPIAEIGNVILKNGLSIEEAAEKCGLNGSALKKSLSRDPHFKLGTDDALKICVMLGDDSFIHAWAKSLERNVVKLPPPKNVSDNPVIHVRASNLALSSFVMVASASANASNPDVFAWLATMLSIYADCMKSAISLSSKTFVSQNEIRQHGFLWSDFLDHASKCPFSWQCTPLLSQVVSDFGAVNEVLNGRLRPAP